MASLQHPFQCLQVAKRGSQGLPDLLIATAGRYLYAYNATNGQRLDAWPQDVGSVTESTSSTVQTADAHAPPEKRRKLSSDSEVQEQKQTSNKKAPIWTVIPLVVTSSDGKYVIALTGEDKAIRVFELNIDGKFKELSSRVMPKRASALALTPDGQNIIIADKFGDVYSIPLIPGEYVKKVVEAKPIGPSATPLTVHTKGNLRTLEMQKLHAERTAKAIPQDDDKLNFEHHTIIGHVSVLTDLLAVSLSGRNYILTGDRDEHIRVSRGLPQAHVIENFCLGHPTMVTKLCIPSWAPHLLVSGDGAGNLFVWNWRQGQILQRISTQETLQSEFMINGIWDISSDQANVILVSFEGSAQLLCYKLEEQGLQVQDTIQLSGNVLDLVGASSSGSVFVSVDTVREAGSIDSWKSSSGAPLESFQITLGADGIKLSATEDPVAANINVVGTSDLPADLNEKQKKEINTSLYNLDNLRKRAFA
ncbi:tRNA (guanine-N(7)-)-methyltransferase non-catalytic subunit trm82 [Penicillium malachiteum]|uniref:tRNA (guanine-N(7)-)-methyltransferase non-catalytic subunit trm82 n=1 Tax=Penicillium malachiteum TaxID=1324776 RepID=UPI0025470451|nr:tRNA (guanine-N(7)-)-methyltransferase non-catalytic subunit trm82 [Penicillium malachiteum]KAJ5712876.1 tRNA (guanine-N(7)-)-methyltransferase non-catalytic subunit trm82 [Penicillium malachiteum]